MALTALAIAALVVIATTIPNFDFSHQPHTSSVAVAVLLSSGLGLVLAVRKARSRPVFGVVMAFYFIWFGLAVLAQIALDHYPLIDDFALDRPLNDGGFRAAVLVAVSLLAFTLGDRLAPAPKERAKHYVPASSRSRLWLLVGAVVLTLVGVAALGGPALLFHSRTDLGAAFRDLSSEDSNFSITKALIRYPSAAGAYGFLAVRVVQTVRRRLDAAVTWLGWFVVALAILVNNPISTPRFWSLSVYGSLAVLGFAKDRAALGRIVRVVPVVVVVAAMFVLPYADVFRRSLDATIEARSPTELMTQKGDYSSWSHTLLAVSYVRAHGTRKGAQTAGVALFFVPRSVWPAKPVSTAIVVADDAGLPNYLNPASPLPAEVYVDYGILGTAVVFALLGGAVSRLDDRFEELVGTGRIPSLGALLVPFLGVYAIYVLRGSLASSVPPLVMVALGVRASFRTRSLPRPQAGSGAGRPRLGSVPVGAGVRPGPG